MYDIKPLEEEWKKYQLQKRKPMYWGISFFLLFILIIAIMNFTDVNHYISKIKTKSITRIKNDKSSLLKNDALKRLEIEDSKSIDIVDEINIDTSSDVLVDIPILNIGDNVNSKVNSDTMNDKIHLNIIETSSIKAYEDVEKRFNQSQDIDDALFLAKSYYKKHNYKKAEYWAYEVNKLDPNLEESLFIFIQSKIKLGHLAESIDILKNYIRKSNSEKAKKLLNKIENNKY